MALERPVAPAARSCRSRSSTRPAPARARCQAVLVPSHPPPITTTSADSVISPSVCAVSTAYRATRRDQRAAVEAGSRRQGPRRGRGSARPRAPEELADDAEELVQAVVVQPVARPVDAGDGDVAEGSRAAVLGQVPGLTLLAVEEQGGAGDPTR